MKRFLIVGALAVAGLVGFLLGRWSPTFFGQGEFRTTITRLSPDETALAELAGTAWPSQPYRIVVIQLQAPLGNDPRTLYTSREQGLPAGTERLIWSRDGTMLLVVGRHFFVKEDLFLDNGDQLFFLHHLPSGRSWSNETGEDKVPPLTAEQVKGVEFTEPVVLKER
jgi:hypothetical protein